MAMVPSWLPNAISVFRIVLVPVWAVVVELANRAGERGEEVGWYADLAVVILVTIGVSDVLDGFLARRFGLTSRFGATLDAVADKLAQVVMVTYLALRTGPAFDAIPVWFLVLLVARDMLLLTGVVVIRMRKGKVAVRHRVHGKTSSVLLFLLLLAFTARHGEVVTLPLLVAIAVLVVWSTALYVRDGFRQLRS